jgi:UDP-GlcNAc:undecaprenyl-phosphate GlcNAc-1-phosphate transferase
MENNTLFIFYSVYFITLVIFSIIINTILLRFANTLGIRDYNTTIIRWNTSSKPALGGITFFISFLISIACSVFFFSTDNLFLHKPFMGLISSVMIAFMMGLADDAYNTRPWIKFFVQLLCGVILILTDNFITITGIQYLDYVLTIIWTIGIMNSINMLDNMDAIATLVSLFIFITILTCIYLSGQIYSFDFFLLLAICASLIGFLFYNWYPSKMFMGDTGSQFLGIILAYFGIKYCWNGFDVQIEYIQAKQLAFTLITFLPTILDTAVVVTTRIFSGKSPFVGGKDHTTHNLAYLGLSDSQVAFVFVGLSVISLFVAISIKQIIIGWSHVYTVLCLLYFFVLYWLMLIIINRNKNK